MVMLSTWALEIVRRHRGGEYLFPSAARVKQSASSKPPKAVSPEFAYKYLRAAILKADDEGVKPAPYTLHDMRRTMTSVLGDTLDADDMPKYPEAVLDRLLNHVKRRVTGRHYNRSTLDRSAAKAWQAWCDHLIGLTKPNVVSIGARS